MKKEMYSLDELRQVRGIGKKTIERIKEQFDESEYVSRYDEAIHIEPNDLVQGDMLEAMNGIPDGSIDMILTDLPYGTTACRWDSVIDFDKLWKQYNRVIRDNGAILLFGSEPFSSKLRNSNIDNYRYDWVWEKDKGTNIFQAKRQPMKNYEDVMVFYKKQPTYNPQMRVGKPYTKIQRNSRLGEHLGAGNSRASDMINETGERYPLATIHYTRDTARGVSYHPTQKPVALLEYLIKTYTNEGEVVLDSTMGSGSTGVACKNTNRRFIGIELDEEYFKIAKERINND